MSGRKNNLLKYQTITNGNMAVSLTSKVTDIQFLDNIGMQFSWTTTGTPAGLLNIQVSADYAQDFSGNVTNAGTWVTVQSVNITVGSPLYFDLNQLSAPYIRAQYARTSGGTGALLQCTITGKML